MGNSGSKSDAYRKPFARKSLGQNFLADPGYVSRIVAALSLGPDTKVLEIGPGRGALTREIIRTGASVTAVEIDTDLAALLETEFGNLPNLRLVTGDILEEDLRRIVSDPPAKVAANLPYYISTPILRKLFSCRDLFSQLVVMLQKEVAERITAPPGDSSRGFLTVLLERGFASEKLFDVPAGAFRPVPKVESAVVRLTTKHGSLELASDDLFEALASAAFRQKRKTLKNNLGSAEGRIRERIGEHGGPEKVLRSSGIDPVARAEALSVEEWESLFLTLRG